MTIKDLIKRYVLGMDEDAGTWERFRVIVSIVIIILVVYLTVLVLDARQEMKDAIISGCCPCLPEINESTIKDFNWSDILVSVNISSPGAEP